jgi:hypothetical protein
VKETLRRSIDELLLAVILVTSAAATLAVVIDAMGAGSREHTGRQFQRLLGGIGLGCQANLAHCAWQFDPRLTDDDDAPLDVILGSDVSNPWHSLSLFPAPSGFLEDGLPRPSSGESDGLGIPARRDSDVRSP